MLADIFGMYPAPLLMLVVLFWITIFCGLVSMFFAPIDPPPPPPPLVRRSKLVMQNRPQARTHPILTGGGRVEVRGAVETDQLPAADE
ncbi:hypothetical protein LJR219_002671 [Phenylobacterium sp. LjRoot219]